MTRQINVNDHLYSYIQEIIQLCSNYPCVKEIYIPNDFIQNQNHLSGNYNEVIVSLLQPIQEEIYQTILDLQDKYDDLFIPIYPTIELYNGSSNHFTVYEKEGN